MTVGTGPVHPDDGTVTLTVAADPAHLPLARVVALSCGALAGLPMDRIDDLRQCTQEALAILLAHGCTDLLAVRFSPAAGVVAVTVSGAGADAQAPDVLSFAWLLLAELAQDADFSLADATLTVEFRIAARSAPAPDRLDAT